MSKSPETRLLSLPGGDIALRLWAGPGGHAPHLLFLHANSMCAAIYDALLAPLAACARVTAYDLRGHGVTTLPTDPAQIPYDWHIHRDDLARVAAVLGSGPLLIAGHSMGATVAFETSRQQPGIAQRLLLMDPACTPFAEAAAHRARRNAGDMLPNHMAERSIRRTPHFPDRETAGKVWRERGVFAGWPEESLQAYLDHGLHDAPGGGVVLACDRAWEAANYHGVSASFATAVEQPGPPFALLLAEQGMISAEDEAHIRMVQPEAIVHRMPGTGHMLPITHAEDVRRWLYGLVSGDFPER